MTLRLREAFRSKRLAIYLVDKETMLAPGEGEYDEIRIPSEHGIGLEYADIPIAPGTSVRSDLLFDLKRDHVYVMTDQRLSKVKVQDCAQYTDCNQCLGARDPYCGWCSLENKCR